VPWASLTPLPLRVVDYICVEEVGTLQRCARSRNAVPSRPFRPSFARCVFTLWLLGALSNRMQITAPLSHSKRSKS